MLLTFHTRFSYQEGRRGSGSRRSRKTWQAAIKYTSSSEDASCFKPSTKSKWLILQLPTVPPRQQGCDSLFNSYRPGFPNLFLASAPFSDKFLSPSTTPSTHINTIFSYCIFGLFENDWNNNERKDAFHYKT